MFDLKRIKASLKYGVLGVSGVPESSKPENLLDAQSPYGNTSTLLPVCQSVPDPKDGTPCTPEQNDKCSPVVKHKPAAGVALQPLEHSEHGEHPIQITVCQQQALEKTVQYLSVYLNVSKEILMTRYFTRDDLNDIASGMYDGKLMALAELIETDFKFHCYSAD